MIRGSHTFTLGIKLVTKISKVGERRDLHHASVEMLAAAAALISYDLRFRILPDSPIL